MNMDSVRMERAYVLLDGMENTVLWKDVLTVVLPMGSVVLTQKVHGNVDVIVDGMEKIAVFC